jgi:hypothetical protein
MRRLSGLLQFVIGFVLGVALFVGGISLAGYFIFNRFATNPEKPVFPEEKPKAAEPVAKDTKDKPADAPKSDTKAEAEKPKVEATPTPTPTPKPTLPPGAYNAQVVWGGGLIVRSEPNKQSGTVTSIGYRDKVVVLKNEGEWSQIRVGDSAVGWVRSGNLEKSAESESP